MLKLGGSTHVGLALVASFALVTACSSSDNGNSGGSGTPDSGGSTEPTFTNVYGTILNPTCTSHHSGGTNEATGNLDMSSQSLAYTNLVGVAASSASLCSGKGLTRVVAGNHAESLIYQKVAGTPTCGAQMPEGGPYLSTDQVALIAAWIDDGAPNN